MNVINLTSPAGGVVQLTRQQLSELRNAGIVPNAGTGDGAEQAGIPDFTDDEVRMIIEDMGSTQRALAMRRYH